ncbi:hypothetical protein ACJMK2_033340 [Sinanodonta woodiana]|uniref:DBB domain-containing protein n=1 Tax=Sinanodonta woodiana TaxID=1069815 RepID=A0ABD3WN30_SINWO
MSTHKISVCYHPHDGAEWAKYLQSKLGEREYQIDIALNDVTSDHTSRGKSRINIIAITPDFLDVIDLNIVKCFHQQLSLAILMGVDTEEFTLITRQRGVHDNVQDWLTLTVDGSGESVRHLLMTIVSMYEYKYPPSRIQPIFKEVNNEEVNVYIGLEKKAESEVSVQFNGMDEELKATYTDQYFYSLSLKDFEARMLSTFRVMCDIDTLGKGQIKDHVPSPYQVSTPKCSPCAGPASSIVDGKQTKTQQLWELLKEETDPINTLCQSMGLRDSDRKQLDRKLAEKLSVLCFPEHPSFMNIDENSPEVQRDEKWPTFLHFAAEYNLMRFAEALLSYPALACACMIRNHDGRTPEEIAHYAGHQELSAMLKSFSDCVRGNPRWSIDSGYVDKVRLSQRKSNVEKVRLSSQICSPPPVPRVGSTGRALGTPEPNFQQSALPKERMMSECVSDKPFDTTEIPTQEEKKKGFFSRLLSRSYKPKPRSRTASDGVLDSVRKFQKQNAHIRRRQTHREVSVERESDISRNSSSVSNSTGNEQEQAIHEVPEDTKAKSKKFHIFFRKAETRQSMRLAHAKRDKHIAHPSLPSKKP